MPSCAYDTAPERASVADITTGFAELLFTLGRGEAIRTVEALAAAIANRVNECLGRQAAADWSPSAMEARLACYARTLTASLPAGRRTAVAEDQPVFASCLRIARRAIAGAISDPTDGASAFHRMDEAPDWTRGMLPATSLGGFVFYRSGSSLLVSDGSDEA